VLPANWPNRLSIIPPPLLLVTASNAIHNSNDVFPGSRISVDQYQSAFPGRLPDTADRERFSSKFNGDTIFVDHGSGYVDMQLQVSLNAGQTIMAKRKLKCIDALSGVSIQSYHGDNGFFKSAEFQEELTLHQQTMSFSSTGAHHQNGIAEHAIQQTKLWARAMLLHVLIMWPNQTQIDLIRRFSLARTLAFSDLSPVMMTLPLVFMLIGSLKMSG